MKKKKPLIIISTIVLIILLIVGMVLLVTSKGDKTGNISNLEQGNIYLDDLKYEQALAMYHGVLDIEPQNVEAYLGVVEVYIRTGDFEKALDYAEKGYGLTEDERLKEKADMLENGNIIASNGWIMKVLRYGENGQLLTSLQYLYNESGNKCKVISYGADGVKIDELDILYDSEANCIQTYSDNIESGEISRVEIKYEEGRQVESIFFENDDVTVRQKITQTYDSSGNVCERNDYVPDDKNGFILDEKILYEYDSRGLEVKREIFDGAGILQGYWKFDYNDKEQKISSEKYDENGSLLKRSLMEYSDDGRLTSEKTYNVSGELMGETVYQ